MISKEYSLLINILNCDVECSSFVSQSFVFDDIVNICINDCDYFVLFRLFTCVTNLRKQMNMVELFLSCSSIEASI